MTVRGAGRLGVCCLLAATGLSAAPVPKASPAAGGEWEAPAADRDRKSPLSATPANLQKGRALFQQHCARCHGDKGRGDGPGAATNPEGPADLSDPVFQKLLTDGEIFWKISTGRRRGKQVLMPAMAETIPLEEDRWKLVAFVRSLATPAP